MFDDEQSPIEEKEPTDYTGLIIGAMLAPVFLLFVVLDKADMGLACCIVLGMAMIAIRLRWKLRKHVWFWMTIVSILALQIPLLSIFRWPQGKAPTLFYTMPVGIAEFALFMGVIGLAEKLFWKGVSSKDDEE
jgi:hypothetical protein